MFIANGKRQDNMPTLITQTLNAFTYFFFHVFLFGTSELSTLADRIGETARRERKNIILADDQKAL